MIAFAVLSMILVLGYQYFVLGPQAKKAEKAHAAAVVVAATAPVSAVQPHLSRPAALALSPRIVIDTPRLTGSIALKGARVDDLFLKGYHESLSRTSPLVELLRPEGMANAYFAQQGWVGANLTGLPGPQSLWTVASGGVLSPGHPVTLAYATPGGLAFTRKIDVDAQSMFTVTDTVANQGGAPVTLAPYVSVQRQDLPTTMAASSIVHEGAIGVLGLDKAQLHQIAYKKWRKKGGEEWQSKGGWLGITDKYWMTAFIPNQNETIDARARVTTDPATNIDIYETTYSAAGRAVAPGAMTVEVSHLFAGAKTVPVLDGYKKTLGVPRFDDAVDWGFLWFLTKPIFTLLEFFFQHVGNFGIAILMLTVVIRIITFPLANKGFEMGVKMKKIQPELKALQEKHKGDPAEQQKDMMALYAREKVNPITGCLPVLLQIPIFYSLTKLFTVTIEMRHAPFFGWINDLSARDPTTIMNLFGLIPWDPGMAPLIGGILGGFLHVGVWPVLYGASMMLSTSMSPQTGMDPTQQAMMKFMPLMFVFILAQYSVGLLIYWTWSSLITVIQQYLMMRRFKVENPIDDFFNRFHAKAAAA